MMQDDDGWRPIESAPKDGTVVFLKRVYEGRVIARGPGLFGRLHPAAPSRLPLGLDPLGRLTLQDYEREAQDAKRWAESAKWLRADQMYAFPEPTHWMPISPEPHDAG